MYRFYIYCECLGRRGNNLIAYVQVHSILYFLMNVILHCIWEFLVWLELPYVFHHITVSVALTIRALPIEFVRSSLF